MNYLSRSHVFSWGPICFLSWGGLKTEGIISIWLLKPCQLFFPLWFFCFVLFFLKIMGERVRTGPLGPSPRSATGRLLFIWLFQIINNLPLRRERRFFVVSPAGFSSFCDTFNFFFQPKIRGGAEPEPLGPSPRSATCFDQPQYV